MPVLTRIDDVQVLRCVAGFDERVGIEVHQNRRHSSDATPCLK